MVRSDERGVTIDGVKVRAGILEAPQAPEHQGHNEADGRAVPAQIEPMPMTPEQVADLISRVRAADGAERERRIEQRRQRRA